MVWRNNSNKEDWNALVRKNTMQRDLIGSTQASSERRDRRSLRRHLLEEANKGGRMDTEEIVREYHRINEKKNEILFKMEI